MCGPTGIGPKGEPGVNGTTGFTETLPKERTETGEWSLLGETSAAEVAVGSAVSFNIPLKSAPVAHYIRVTGMEPVYNTTDKKEEEVAQPACPGSAEEPKASAGNLCVYASHEENMLDNLAGSPIILPRICSFAGGGRCVLAGFYPDQGEIGADPYGFGLIALSAAAGFVNTAGTWAATAE